MICNISTINKELNIIIQILNMPMPTSNNNIQVEIEMQVSHISKDSYREQDQDILRSLDDESIQTIQRVLRNPNEKILTIKNRVKIYRLFYVDPLSRYTGLWDLVIIIAIYLFQIQISLTLAFGPSFWSGQLHNKFYTVLYLVLLCFFAVDIALNFNKGFYAFGRGKVIDDPRLIIQNYLKITFFMDLITLGVLIIPLAYNHYYLNFLQLAPAIIMYFKKFRYQTEITSMIQSQKNLRIFFVLTMLGVDVMLIGHFGACIFVGLDLLLWRLQTYGPNPDYYWLSNDSMTPVDLIGGPWVLQYIYAQAFSTGTLSTVAPGPFPKNPIEVLYSNLVMIFFMFLASYAAEVIVGILVSESQIRTFHEQNIQKFDKFLKVKGVSDKISKRVNNFFQLIWETQVKMNIEQEKAIIEKLPTSIKEQLIMEMEFIQRLRVLQFFSNKNLLIRVLSLKVSTMVIDSGTTLFLEGKTQNNTLDQNYIFHFKDGLAKYYVNNNKQQLTLALSNVQRTVGQFELFTGLPFIYSCKSIDLCKVSKVSNKDTLEALKQNQMIEQFHVLRYKILIDSESFLISKFCTVCEGHHVEQRCPYLNPSLEIKEQYMEDFSLQKNKRKKYTRRNFKTKKQRQTNIDVIAHGYIIQIFLAFRELHSDSVNINERVDQITNFDKYFAEFNLQ